MTEYGRIIKLIKKNMDGSGFNYGWKASIKYGNLYMDSLYDYMDENGIYDCVLPFSVVFKNDDYKIIFHRLNNHERYIVESREIKDYFEQCVDYALMR